MNPFKGENWDDVSQPKQNKTKQNKTKPETDLLTH